MTFLSNGLFPFTKEQFGRELARVLSPSQTIQTPELLRGRADQLDEIRQAFYAPGRQVFIYGNRGVGKSSLAQTAAFERQSSDNTPIMVSCVPGTTCFDISQAIASRAVPSDPRQIKATVQRAAKLGFGGFGIELRAKLERGSIPKPTSLNDCCTLLEFVGATHSATPVVVIDEFDQITDKTEQANFANLVKMIGDYKVRINLIFCGIGESLDQLFNAHMSTHRYFHTVELPRLPYDPRIEIIDVAAEAMGVRVDDTSRFRIAMISDGFPHYVHLLCEKLFWSVFHAENGLTVTPALFEKALCHAVQAMQPELKRPYDLATKKYANDYEPILWAAADGDDLQRPSRDIYESYKRIMMELGKEPLAREKFNAKINNLKQTSHAEILVGSRSGWYEYREKIVRGYARLRAMQSAVQLEREHPLQMRRFGYTG